MSELQRNKTTEHLAMVLCLQLADDFAHLNERFGYNRRIEIDRLDHAETFVPMKVFLDPNGLKMYRSIIRNYKQHAEFLKGIKYG